MPVCVCAWVSFSSRKLFLFVIFSGSQAKHCREIGGVPESRRLANREHASFAPKVSARSSQGDVQVTMPVRRFVRRASTLKGKLGFETTWISISRTAVFGKTVSTGCVSLEHNACDSVVVVNAFVQVVEVSKACRAKAEKSKK